MSSEKIVDRLSFLSESFDVYEDAKEKLNSLAAIGYTSKCVESDDRCLGIYSTIKNSKGRELKKISVSSDVFTEMIIADPTENKVYVQWMLNIYSQLLKNDTEKDNAMAVRLVLEDLPHANEYILLFEENKRKKKFKELCKISYSLVGITDPTNINQYKSLPQLFDSVDPFIERDVSVIEKMMKRFVDSGQAEMPLKDRHFTVYIPKSLDASVLFSDFASWCTARKGNSMFKSYTGNNKRPDGKASLLYIIINNDFFKGESSEIYQIHFESNQFKDKSNSSVPNIFESVLNKSEGLSNYFKSELFSLAKSMGTNIDGNKYLKHLIDFGLTNSIFEILDDDIKTIKIMTNKLKETPDLSKFTEVTQLILTENGLKELNGTIGVMKNLKMLVLTNNKLFNLPKEIGDLKNLEFLNLNGNPLREIPTEISYLDISKGGSLKRVGMKSADVGEENYKRIKELLPSAMIV